MFPHDYNVETQKFKKKKKKGKEPPYEIKSTR